MIELILKATRAAQKNRLEWVVFTSISVLFGVSIQLIWINRHCIGLPILGVEVDPCRENAYRLILGGPLGIILLHILYLTFFGLYRLADEMMNEIEVSSGILKSMFVLGLAAAIPILGEKAYNLISLSMIALLFVLLRLNLPSQTKKLVFYLKRMALPDSALLWESRLAGGRWSVTFSGVFVITDARRIFEVFSREFSMLPEAVETICIDISTLKEIPSEFSFIYLNTLGFCKSAGLTFEFVANPNQTEELRRIIRLIGVKNAKSKKKNAVGS